MLETPNLRIHFEVLDPDLGCLVLESPHIRIIFEVLDPDLGWLLLETQHLGIIFEVLDPDLVCLALETNFPRTCSKNTVFFAVWQPARYTKADPPDPDKMSHRGQLWP